MFELETERLRPIPLPPNLLVLELKDVRRLEARLGLGPTERARFTHFREIDAFEW